MQHSFMITPKRIGSNLVNSYEYHHNQQVKPNSSRENHQTVDNLELPASITTNMNLQSSHDEDDDLNLGSLNLTRTKTSARAASTHQVYLRHERGISFSKEVDSQVLSDDEDDDLGLNLKCISKNLKVSDDEDEDVPMIATKPHHTKRGSVVT